MATTDAALLQLQAYEEQLGAGQALNGHGSAAVKAWRKARDAGADLSGFPLLEVDLAPAVAEADRELAAAVSAVVWDPDERPADWGQVLEAAAEVLATAPPEQATVVEAEAVADEPKSGYAKRKEEAKAAEPLILWDQVERFLALLGRTQATERLVLALFPPDPSKPMLHKPQPSGAPSISRLVRVDIEKDQRRRSELSLGMVINRPAPEPENWGKLAEHFSGKTEADRELKRAVWNEEVEGQRWRNRPRVWGASNAHISEAVAVWFECDGGLSIEEQEVLHQKVGLPLPSFTLWSGGKSLHCYYRLSEPIPPERFHFLMDWIVRALKAVCPDAGADASLKNPCRVMRVAGGFHGTKRGRARIHSEQHGERCYTADELAIEAPDPSGVKTYTADELEAALPAEHRPKERGTKALQDSLETIQLHKSSKGPGRPKLNWFEKLSPEQQVAEAVSMLKVVPPRQKPSDEGGPPGTRGPAIKVLSCLACHFGKEKAVDICRQADWQNQWWDPEEELGKYEPNAAGIEGLLSAAAEHGYKSPEERHRQEIQAKADLGDGIKQALKGEWCKGFKWMLNAERTVEVVIEEALAAQAAEHGSKWLSHQGTFRRYRPDLGYYERVTHEQLTREITALLRRVYELVQKGQETVVVRKQTTAAKAAACCNWMASTVGVADEALDPLDQRRLAFHNGTAYHDGTKWVLGEHSPDNLLSFGIEGNWVDNAECPPFFTEFIRTSYGLKWLHVIRGVISYTADPVHICRVLVMLLGLSGTGKGSLERLMEKMFPPRTVAVLQSCSDISTPEKVAQMVLGRRLLAFPDLQGHQSALGTLYSLTESGLLTGRRLYSSETIEARFRGRVVICSTQAPSFDNAGTGIARRILTIPTLQRRLPSDILPKDSQEFDAVLASEIGQLVSWALQMPADEVEQILQRNDPEGLLKAANQELEVNLDATRQFIDTCLEPAPGDTEADLDRLFDAYRLFSAARGWKGVCNQSHFISRLKGALPHLHRPRRRGANGVRLPAGFFGFRLVKGLWHRSDERARQWIDANSLPGTGGGHGYGHDYYENPDIETGPKGCAWGALLKTQLQQGGFKALQEHQPEDPEPLGEE